MSGGMPNKEARKRIIQREIEEGRLKTLDKFEKRLKSKEQKT